MLQRYELVILLNTHKLENIALSLKKVMNYIDSHSGKVLNIESWGRRSLAFKIKNHVRANYIQMDIETSTESVEGLRTLINREYDVILSNILLNDPKVTYKHKLIDEEHSSLLKDHMNFTPHKND